MKLATLVPIFSTAPKGGPRRHRTQLKGGIIIFIDPDTAVGIYEARQSAVIGSIDSCGRRPCRHWFNSRVLSFSHESILLHGALRHRNLGDQQVKPACYQQPLVIGSDASNPHDRHQWLLD